MKSFLANFQEVDDKKREINFAGLILTSFIFLP